MLRCKGETLGESYLEKEAFHLVAEDRSLLEKLSLIWLLEKVAR